MLNRLCRLGSDPIGRPFAVGDWAVATDGHMLLAVRNDDVAEYNSLAPVAAVRPWLDEAPSGAVVSLVELRAFAGDPTWESRCDECDGTGQIDCVVCEGNGTVACTCAECGNEHTRNCSECDGAAGKKFGCENCGSTGHTTELVGSVDPVAVAGVSVDPRRLARLLACSPTGETVQVAARDGGTALALWGDGWCARLMALTGAPTRTFDEARAALAAVESTAAKAPSGETACVQDAEQRYLAVLRALRQAECALAHVTGDFEDDDPADVPPVAPADALAVVRRLLHDDCTRKA